MRTSLFETSEVGVTAERDVHRALVIMYDRS